MNKNEYRRALIMLRSMQPGISGYVRLERRTLMGTLQFTVNGADANTQLYALLLYRQNGAWQAVKLTAFGAPRYGQTGVLWKFDPRNIQGRALEQYALAAVASVRGGVCDLPLCGNLNAAVEVDWTQVRQAACRLFAPAQISGEPISPIDTGEAVEESPGSAPDSPNPPPADDAQTATPENAAPPAEEEPAAPSSEPAPAESAAPEEGGQDGEPDGARVFAIELLNLTDTGAPWPEEIEPLRALFASSPAVAPFEEEGFVLISAPLPGESGPGSCVAGIAVEDGVPARVLYGIPARYTPEPPAGLEGYAWRGDGPSGYWVTWYDLKEEEAQA